MRIFFFSFFLFLLQVSFAFADNTQYRSPFSKSVEDRRGEIYFQIYEVLHCPAKPCNIQTAATLYEELLTLDNSSHNRLGYANVLKRLAKTDIEKEKANTFDQTAAYEYVFMFTGSDKLIATLADALSHLYRIGILFPSDMKQSKRWSHISQSYKEKEMYRLKK